MWSVKKSSVIAGAVVRNVAAISNDVTPVHYLDHPNDEIRGLYYWQASK